MHWSVNLQPAVRLISSACAGKPSHVCALIVAPNVGRPGDQYTAENIAKAEDEVDQALREEQLQLQVRRGALQFDSTCLGSKRSNRPGLHTFWLVYNNQKDAEGKPACRFAASYMAVRKCSKSPVHGADRGTWVNPCAGIARLAGADNLSKAQRSKQWATGLQFWDEVRDSLLTWLDFDASYGICYIQTFPYDATLPMSICRSRSKVTGKSPAEMVIGTLFANMGTVGAMAEETVDNSRIESFSHKSIRNFVMNELKDKRLKITGYTPLPLQAAGDAGGLCLPHVM